MAAQRAVDGRERAVGGLGRNLPMMEMSDIQMAGREPGGPGGGRRRGR
jgi:hypothetical protein